MTRKVIACALVAALVAGCGGTFASARAGKAEKAGDRHMARGDYQKAHEAYAKAGRLKGSGPASFKDAYCLKRMGDVLASSNTLADAAGLGVDQARFLVTVQGGASSQAVLEFVEAHSDNPYVWTVLGDAYFEEGAYENAVECYKTALGLPGDSGLKRLVYYNMSVTSLNKGDYEEAERSFSAYATRLNAPLSDRDLLLLGVMRYANSNVVGAAEAWSKLPPASRKEIAAAVGHESRTFAALAD